VLSYSRSSSLSADESDMAIFKGDHDPVPVPAKSQRPAEDDFDFDDPQPPAVTTTAQKVSKGELVPEVDKKLADLARQIASAKRKVVQSMLAIGQSLAEAQSLLADHDGGAFGKWVRQKCGFTSKTGYRYLAAWRTFGGCDRLTQGKFSAEAMYLLGSDQAPQEAVDEALEAAKSGAKVTKKLAAQIIGQHSPKRKRDEGPAPVFVETPSAMVIIKPKVEGLLTETILEAAIRQVREQKREAA